MMMKAKNCNIRSAHEQSELIVPVRYGTVQPRGYSGIPWKSTHVYLDEFRQFLISDYFLSIGVQKN